MKEFFGSATSENLNFADLHIHSTASDGLRSPIWIVEEANKQNLSAIAFTDHEVIDGGVLAKEYCLSKGYPLEVVIGSEISCARNVHIIGLYLQDRIPSGKSIEWTIKEIHEQNGLAIAAHPFFGLFSLIGFGSISQEKVESIISKNDPKVYFDGFEIFNGAVYNIPFGNSNQKAKDFYLLNSDALGTATGGSDTHCQPPGSVVTGYEKNLRDAIEQKRTSVFYREEKNPIEMGVIARQLFAGLAIEPLRRMGRSIHRSIQDFAN